MHVENFDALCRCDGIPQAIRLRSQAHVTASASSWGCRCSARGIRIGASACSRKEPQPFSESVRKSSLVEDLRRPGRDRHRERAAVQRDQGGASSGRERRRREILRVIASSPSDVQPVFDTIVRHAAELVGGVTRQRLHDTTASKLHMVATSAVRTRRSWTCCESYLSQMHLDRSTMVGPRRSGQGTIVRMEDALADRMYDKRPRSQAEWASDDRRAHAA